jgi:hypothetical protein
VSDTVAERVARGAALLDIHDPQWWRRDVRSPIDLKALDLDSPCKCVLGQRHPTTRKQSPWNRGLQLLGLRPYWGHGNAVTDADCGFNSRFESVREDEPCPERDDDIAALKAEWVRVITERRAAS